MKNYLLTDVEAISTHGLSKILSNKPVATIGTSKDCDIVLGICSNGERIDSARLECVSPIHGAFLMQNGHPVYIPFTISPTACMRAKPNIAIGQNEPISLVDNDLLYFGERKYGPVRVHEM